MHFVGPDCETVCNAVCVLDLTPTQVSHPPPPCKPPSGCLCQPLIPPPPPPPPFWPSRSQDASGEWYDADEASGAAQDDASGAQAGDHGAAAPPAGNANGKKRKKKSRIPIPEDPVTPLTTEELLQKYFAEACATAVIALYFLNYLYGRFSNSSLAHVWLKSTTDSGLWNEAFAATGCPNPTPAGAKLPVLHCEALNLYRFHATGRQHCSSFQVSLALKPR